MWILLLSLNISSRVRLAILSFNYLNLFCLPIVPRVKIVVGEVINGIKNQLSSFRRDDNVCNRCQWKVMPLRQRKSTKVTVPRYAI